MVFGYWQGRKRGLGFQVYKFLMMLIPLALGCGLFRLAGRVLSLVPAFDPENAGFSGFLAVTSVSFLLLLKLRGALRAYLEKKLGADSSSRKAGMAGLLRYAVVALGLIAGIELSPVDFFVSESFLGKAISLLLEAPTGS